MAEHAPPRHRFECPRGHVQLKIRHSHIYCFRRNNDDLDCWFQELHDKFENCTLTQDEFAECWGTHVWPVNF